MRRRLLWASPVALAVFVGGCAFVHPPVPVRVEAGSADLAGVWEGTYESRDTGRVGSLTFALTASADSAVGEVVMMPRGQGAVVRRDDDRWVWQGVARPQILTIRFVRLSGTKVVGELDPYPDPDCGCQLQTTFRGEVEGEVAFGTFSSQAEHDEHDAEGTWRAVRKPGPSAARGH